MRKLNSRESGAWVPSIEDKRQRWSVDVVLGAFARERPKMDLLGLCFYCDRAGAHALEDLKKRHAHMHFGKRVIPHGNGRRRSAYALNATRPSVDIDLESRVDPTRDLIDPAVILAACFASVARGAEAEEYLLARSVDLDATDQKLGTRKARRVGLCCGAA